MLVPLQLKPGINTDITRYAGENAYIDGNLCRFFQGLWQTIDGWESLSQQQFQGLVRGMLPYEGLDGTIYLIAGSDQRLGLFTGGVIFDVTPLRRSSISSDPFATLAGSSVVIVTDPAHDSVTGDIVNITNTAPVGGISISGDFVVTFISATQYSITVPDQTATLSTTGGGPSVNLNYYIEVGATSGSGGTGFGTGPYGDGTFGTPRGQNTPRSTRAVRTWTFDNWGQDAMCNYAGGPIFIKRTSDGNSGRATQIPNAPLNAECILVAMPQRQLIAFGAESGGVVDPMLIRWSDSEDFTVWTATNLNEAGSFRIQGGARIVRALHGNQEILVFTDTHLHSMQFLGFPLVFGFTQLGEGCGLIAQNAAVTYNGIAYWFGVDNFYTYDGRIQVMDCPVRRRVFNDINLGQRAKFHAGFNKSYNEVWFYYCSAASDEIDRYVAVSVVDGTWHVGQLQRTSYVDGQSFNAPLACDASGNLFQHETGTTAAGLPLAWSMSTGLFEFGEGDRFMFVDKIIPDFFLADGDSVTMTLDFFNYPNSPPTSQAFTFTNQSTFQSLRKRCRAAQVVFSGTVPCRMGKPRLNIQPDGSR